MAQFNSSKMIIFQFEFSIAAIWSRRVKNWLRPSLATMHKLYTGWPWLWKVVNNVPFLHRAAMRYVYLSRGAAIQSPPRFNSGHDYITTESHFNTSYYARSLPPVPQHCPTPMGVAGRRTPHAVRLD